MKSRDSRKQMWGARFVAAPKQARIEFFRHPCSRVGHDSRNATRLTMVRSPVKFAVPNGSRANNKPSESGLDQTRQRLVGVRTEHSNVPPNGSNPSKKQTESHNPGVLLVALQSSTFTREFPRATYIERQILNDKTLCGMTKKAPHQMNGMSSDEHLRNSPLSITRSRRDTTP